MILITDNFSKSWTEEKIADQNFYIVYNLAKTQVPRSAYNINDIIYLYSLLLMQPGIVNIEYHESQDKLFQEIRVIWWNKQYYQEWADAYIEEYQNLKDCFDKSKIENNIEYQRITSDEGYTSEFPYIEYPKKNELVSWTLIDFYKDYVIKNIIPLGVYRGVYLGNGNFDDPNKQPGTLSGARFMKERTSSIVRNPENRNKNIKNFPCKALSYTIDHAVQVAMYDAPIVYKRLSKLVTDVEKFAETYILECTQSAVNFGHSSLGTQILTHTHQQSTDKRLTLTIAVRLTFNDKPVIYKFWNPIDDLDPNLDKYYGSSDLVAEYIDNQTPIEIQSEYRSSVLVFNGSYTPHTVEFNNDIYMYFAYDNVVFKPDALEKIKQQSERSAFTDLEEEKHLYFFNF
jgi:hypothetical protein